MDVRIRDLVRRFGDVVAVDGITLTVPEGRCLALLGPSGCGKTTTLNIVAGFQAPDGGDVQVGGRSVVGIPPHRRNTGMVFQNYALFPHLTVFENVAYGLRQRRVDGKALALRVAQALATVRLGDLGHRYPRELSGGQQQRVALARAIVFEPDILLLDEPLSNLDAKLRETMRLELKQIQRTTGVTTIFVTHDQAEAMVLADEIAVMNRGRIEQIAGPEHLYNQPATRFVADFVGSANFLKGTLLDCKDGFAHVRLDGSDRIVRAASPDFSDHAGKPCEIMIRPERLHMSEEATGSENEIAAQVATLAFSGAHTDCFCRLGAEQSLHLQFTSGRHQVQPSQTIHLRWTATDAYALKA